MARVHTNGVLFKNTFGTPEMRSVFCEERFIERFLEVEAALARAEATVGVVPESAAEAITAKASLSYVDLDDVEQNVADIHLFTMAIIGAWKDQVGDEGEYIHWGATSQDISDTALVLQIREGVGLLKRDLDAICGALERLAEDHAETPMIGRTHHVHAIPITFGLKAASWLDEVNRHRDRLDDLEERLYAVQFFGAVGSLASLGDVGIDVQRALAAELDLSVPDVAWYAARDRLAELLSVLTMVTSTMNRIARQVLMENRPEIGELEEPIGEGAVGSSTMPHKRNPVRSEEALMLGRLMRGHAGTMFELMEGYDERDFSTALAEFAVVPESFLYASRSLAYVHEVLAGLVVNPERMQENLDIFGGLVASEAVLMALAEEVGRQTAHDVLHEAAMDAFHGERSFADVLRADDRVTAALSDADIDRLTDPSAYTGLSATFARRVASASRNRE